MRVTSVYVFSHFPNNENSVITGRGVKIYKRKPQLVGGAKFGPDKIPNIRFRNRPVSSIISIVVYFYIYEPFGLGCFATDQSHKGREASFVCSS